MSITNVTGKECVPQYALFIFCWVAQLEVTLFALVIAEDYMALYALQGKLRRCEETGQKRVKVFNIHLYS